MKNYVYKTYVILALLTIIGPKAFCQNHEMLWARQTGGPGWDVGIAITADDYGNVYYCGGFEGTSDFDPGSGKAIYTANFRDIHISKRYANGALAWAKKIGGKANDQAMGIKTDRLGNIYVTGQFAYAVDFDTIRLDAGSEDVFVCKLDSTGHVIWAKSMGGKGKDIPYNLDVDEDGNVYTTGEFEGTADFNPGPATHYLVSAGQADVFISKLDADGNFLWAKSYGGPNMDYCTSIAVDKQQNVYTVGHFKKSINLNPDTINRFIVNGIALGEVFITKLDASGNFVWGKTLASMNTNSNSFCYSVKTDRFGHVFLAGSFNGTVDFNAKGNNAYPVTVMTSNTYIAKYAGNGELIWVKYSPVAGTPRSLAVDYQGCPYAMGSYVRSGNLNPGSGPADTFNVTAAGSSDLFLYKLDTAGRFQWGKSIGGSQSEYAFSVFVDKKKSVYATGYFSGDINFDTALADANFKLLGDCDIFAFKIEQSCPDTSLVSFQVELCEDAYTFNQETYTQSGSYTYNYLNETGCDSTVLLQLHLNGAIEKPFITVDEFLLSTTGTYYSYQWYFNDEIIPGATEPDLKVTQNGYYRVVVNNQNGCKDSSDNYRITNVVGIPSITGESQIQLYPNPSENIFYIKSPAPVFFKVYDMQGRVVLQQEEVKQINLSGYPKGMYNVTITDKEGRFRKQEKIVIGF